MDKYPTLERISRIAIFRALNLGDVLCAVPALRSLKGLLPEAETTFIGLPWARSLCDRLPYVNCFWEFPGFPGIDEVPIDYGKAEAFFARARQTGFDLAI